MGKTYIKASDLYASISSHLLLAEHEVAELKQRADPSGEEWEHLQRMAEDIHAATQRWRRAFYAHGAMPTKPASPPQDDTLTENEIDVQLDQGWGKP